MKRYSYLLLVALLLLGLIVPVTYSSWVQKKDQPVGQTGTPVREETAPAEGTDTTPPTADGEEKGTETGSANSRSEAVGPLSAASGKMPAEDSQQKQAPQQPQKTAAEPAPSASGSGTVVGIAVVGSSGELLYGPAEVRIGKESSWGVTALGALDATGLPYTLSPRYADLVDSIAGQRNRGQSGWMYNVNGEIPAVAAAKKPLKQGDKVIWWYSKSIDQAPPSWDDLEKQR